MCSLKGEVVLLKGRKRQWVLEENWQSLLLEKQKKIETKQEREREIDTFTPKHNTPQYANQNV